MDRYAVVGHPVAHSQSPAIHARFAELTGQALAYERLELPLDGFLTGIEAARAAGLRGGNVTVPFKLEAFAWAQHRSARAELAQACNTFWFEADGVHGDNTDGIGLVRDITRNAGVALHGARVLLVGAGGAGAGVLGPLLSEGPAELVLDGSSSRRIDSNLNRAMKQNFVCDFLCCINNSNAWINIDGTGTDKGPFARCGFHQTKQTSIKRIAILCK